MILGIIGGSGLYSIEELKVEESINLTTPYGDPSAPYIKGSINGREVVFLARHGSNHSIPPHRINFRANLWGLKELGVKRILSVNATGGIGKGYTPGSIVLLSQIIDMTFGSREGTFFDANRVAHIDFTEPFCSELRRLVLQAAKIAKRPILKKGVYVCTNGPRLETAQEIRFYSKIGADVVGMTLMPEASLARELEICYAALAVVTNAAAGISMGRLTAKEVIETMRQSAGHVRDIINALITSCVCERSCQCGEALKDAFV